MKSLNTASNISNNGMKMFIETNQTQFHILTQNSINKYKKIKQFQKRFHLLQFNLSKQKTEFMF